MIGTKDITLKDNRSRSLLSERHEKYLKQYANDDSGPEQIMAEYLKMSGIYWGVNALHLMSALDGPESSVVQTRALEFIRQCQTVEGGFAAAPRHDPHILHTLSAIQVLVILNKCEADYIDVDRCVNYIKTLQQEDGSFFGDKWGEVDARFSFCALASLKLMNRLEAINMEKAVQFIMDCNNQIDGGFGSKPGSESHAAYVYCCVGSLHLAGRLDLVDAEQLGWWLSERQLPSGGLNGRPEKLPDLCYSWWCLSSMRMIDRMHLIDHKRLVEFILACQDEEQGGFSDRPGNWVDPYHTMFGIASLSLLTHDKKEQASPIEADDRFEKFKTLLKPVSPVLCMPLDRLEHVGANE